MVKTLSSLTNWGSLRRRYKNAKSAKRKQLLDELCHLSGMNRKYLIRKLNETRPRQKRRRGPKLSYPPDDYLLILKRIWLCCDQLCSKKLAAILPDWLVYYEQEYEPIAESIRLGLSIISASTIDRLLKPIRVSPKKHGLCGTKPGTLIRNQIPIKTNQWEENRVGYVEADTVAHCGNSLSVDYVWRLTVTDIVTTWTENRATWNKGAHGVAKQIEAIEGLLPFDLKGFDCGNGSEFLNQCH